MSGAKFAVGDRVTYLPDKIDANVSRGSYTIVRVMPRGTDGYSYRVKNANDTHERVMAEVQLVSG